jgi:hypothetical protein
LTLGTQLTKPFSANIVSKLSAQKCILPNATNSSSQTREQLCHVSKIQQVGAIHSQDFQQNCDKKQILRIHFNFFTTENTEDTEIIFC